MTIDMKILALLSPEGFDKRFWEIASKEKTYIQAYEELEKEYELHFGRRRYSDYNSFRICRNKRIRKANK
jgi:hypothetical protein